MKTHSRPPFTTFAVILMCCFARVAVSLGQVDGGIASTPPAGSPATNEMDMVRAYLRVQEQFHATQLSLEQNRREMDETAQRTARELGLKIEMIERALTAGREQELNAALRSQRLLLTAVVSFGGIGLLALLLTAYFHWNAIHRLSAVTRALTPTDPPMIARAPLALPSGETSLVTTDNPAPETRLLSALSRLEDRIHQLERTGEAPLPPPSGDSAPPTRHPPATGDAAAVSLEETEQNACVPVLLGKGQSLLLLNQPADALRCFNEALELDPDNAEVLVKKGTALEKLDELEEALAHYDRAIALDASLTIAYLQKGGVYNRMERYEEALACYEKALISQQQTEQKNAAA